MKVRATARGFYGNRLRNEDDVFDVPEGTKGSWFIALKDAKKVNRSEDRDPETEQELPGTIEDAMKLTNNELRELLTIHEVKFNDGATKAELAKLAVEAKGKEDAEDLV